MIKKLISFFIILSLSVIRVSAFDPGSVSAECAVVMNVHTGEVIFAKNEHQKQSMASTTKIMTSLLAIESGELQSEIVVSEHMLGVEGTSMGLLAGDSVSLDELVYGMMLSSGNDAAEVAAIHIGGNIENFSILMNQKAQQIGMLNTNFVTPSGLDDENHYSTAYDMALLGSYAVKNPKFASVCSLKKATVSYGNPPYLRTLYNHNKLLDYYDFALGIKTGFTKKSGRCLVSYAVKDNAELIAVTLNAPDDWNDHIRMFDYAFGTLVSGNCTPDIHKNIKVVGGKKDSVSISAEPCKYSVSDENIEVTTKVYIEQFIYAPVKKDMVVGKCEYYIQGKLFKVVPILTCESIDI